MCQACCFGGCYAVCIRKDIRSKQGIKGCLLMDCMLKMCCGACTMVQETEQLGSSHCKWYTFHIFQTFISYFKNWNGRIFELLN